MEIYNDNFVKHLEDIVGTNINVKESTKSKTQKEQRNFCEIVQNWDKAWQRGNTIFRDTGIDLGDYEASHYKMIEDLFIMLYGSKSGVVFWWVYERYSEDGEVATLVTEEGEKHKLSTPLQLYKFIKKLK
tara:strand:+ start:364 stop:753 length:390 start_codon:yes stop_codon:yes gene_type:complete